MKINWNYIKAFFLLGLVVFLLAFSSNKNDSRRLKTVSVSFLGDENLYITETAVNKLLIQNDQGVTNVPKEIIDLNELESTLSSNAMIKAAEVYLTVDGEVKAEVAQRRPIARVFTDVSYYVDDEGMVMPLSANHTARVPLVTGSIDKDNLDLIFNMARRIDTDEFLKKHIIEIHQTPKQTIVLKPRTLDFQIVFGDLSNMDKKINNLKAFYQKARKDKVLDKYSKVNLQFVNQVVCTKK